MNVIAKQIGSTEDGNIGSFYTGIPIGGSTYKMKSSLCGDLSTLYTSDVLSAISFIGDYTNLRIICTYAKLVEGQYSPMNDTFVPNGMVGISSNTKKPELAKDFVTYLFTEKEQAQHIDDGFPINASALATWELEPYNKNDYAVGGLLMPNGTEKFLTFDAVTVEQKRRVIEEVRNLTKPVTFDTPCWDMLLDGSVEYLKGEKTLEQATAEISQKVNLYLSE